MAEKQVYVVDGEDMVISHEIKDKNDLVVMEQEDGYGWYKVVYRKDLVKKEDSYQYKNAQKRADELRLITQKAEENFESICERVISASCKALQARMKMNILFGNNSSGNSWAVVIADELEKLIKEKAPKIIEDKKDQFA